MIALQATGSFPIQFFVISFLLPPLILANWNSKRCFCILVRVLPLLIDREFGARSLWISICFVAGPRPTQPSRTFSAPFAVRARLSLTGILNQLFTVTVMVVIRFDTVKTKKKFSFSSLEVFREGLRLASNCPVKDGLRDVGACDDKLLLSILLYSSINNNNSNNCISISINFSMPLLLLCYCPGGNGPPHWASFAFSGDAELCCGAAFETVRRRRVGVPSWKLLIDAWCLHNPIVICAWERESEWISEWVREEGSDRVSESVYFLFSPSQRHRGDQAGSAHTVKAPAFPIPSEAEGLVYSLRWCWDQWQSIAWPSVERPVSER